MTRPLENIKSAVVHGAPYRAAKSITYDGVAIKKSRMLWASDINTILKIKKSGGGMFARRASLKSD